MNTEEFVDGIHTAVYKTSIEAVIKTIANPPGRRPRHDLVELSSWYNGLSDADKSRVRAVVRHAVDQAIFNMLCVFDGVMVIDDRHTDLYLRTGDGTLLNDPLENELHALFQITVDHELGYVDDMGRPLPDAR
jgi:hypothetical protein